MEQGEHGCESRIEWTGNRGQGTASYRGYDRTWDIAVPGKEVVHCSNDPLLGGDPARMNPEDLLLSALSACHMLWFLHLASSAGIVVHSYADTPLGIGRSAPDGSGQFVRAVLRPRIGLARMADAARADALHHEVGGYCFIARSVNFPVAHEASYHPAEAAAGGNRAGTDTRPDSFAL